MQGKHQWSKFVLLPIYHKVIILKKLFIFTVFLTEFWKSILPPGSQSAVGVCEPCYVVPCCCDVLLHMPVCCSHIALAAALHERLTSDSFPPRSQRWMVYFMIQILWPVLYGWTFCFIVIFLLAISGGTKAMLYATYWSMLGALVTAVLVWGECIRVYESEFSDTTDWGWGTPTAHHSTLIAICRSYRRHSAHVQH